jgi:hypothetical protein
VDSAGGYFVNVIEAALSIRYRPSDQFAGDLELHEKTFKGSVARLLHGLTMERRRAIGEDALANAQIREDKESVEILKRFLKSLLDNE